MSDDRSGVPSPDSVTAGLSSNSHAATGLVLYSNFRLCQSVLTVLNSSRSAGSFLTEIRHSPPFGSGG